MSDWSMAQGDATEFLKAMPDSSVDLISTDAAYESLEKHRKVGTTTRLKKSAGSDNEWFDIFRNDRFPEFLAESYRVLKPHRHLYMWCDVDTMFVIKPLGEDAGFKFWKPLIWDKVSIGMGYHYRARCERILFFEKGKRKLTDLGVPDVLTAKRIRGGYPTEKPAEISQILITQSTQPGELVVDPFSGSGSTGVAAIANGRRFMGNDLKPDAVAHATGRLRYAEMAMVLGGDPLKPIPYLASCGVQ